MHVPRVKPDAWLVENVQHVRQAAPEVLHDSYALRFSAGERIRLAIEAEILEADIYDVFQALRQGGDEGRRLWFFDGPGDLDELADFHGGHVGDVEAVDPAREGFLAEPGALAERAGAGLQVGHGLLPPPLREAVDLRDDSREGEVDRALAEFCLELPVLAIEEELHFGLGVIAELLVVIEEARRHVGLLFPIVEERYPHRSLAQGLAHVEEILRYYADFLAQAIALGAHPARIVEGIGDRPARRRPSDA